MSHFSVVVKLRSAFGLRLEGFSIPDRSLIQHVCTMGCSSRQVMALLSQGFILPGNYHWLWDSYNPQLWKPDVTWIGERELIDGTYS